MNSTFSQKLVCKSRQALNLLVSRREIAGQMAFQQITLAYSNSVSFQNMQSLTQNVTFVTATPNLRMIYGK